MSIDATTNYMSNSSIEAWMEQKTEGLYGSMGDAMDTSDRRADAERELNKIKSLLTDAKSKGCDATTAYTETQAALAEYADVPELVQALGPIAEDLSEANEVNVPMGTAQSGFITATTSPGAAQPLTVQSSQIDGWVSSIGDTVDGLGKQDQLGLINIQEFNSQINQTKQIASALMDAADKAAEAIINHIS
jgi:hypothetical protein